MRSSEKESKVICIGRKELPALLGCGQATADRIAREAGARIKVGKRTLVLLAKIEQYLQETAE